MSNLPKSIRRQLEEANRIQAGLIAQAEPESPAPEPAQVEPEPAPAPKPKVGDEDPNSPTWQQRYRTLQGEFNAKVPQLQAALKEQTAKNQELEQRLTQLENAKPVEKLTTEKDEEEFGADMLDLIDRKAREIVQIREQQLVDTIRRLEARLEQTQGTLTQVAESNAASAQERMVAKLTQLVPDWAQVNESSDFLEWLGEPDPFTGIVRQQVLDDAAKANDPERIANVFRTFAGSRPAQPQTDSLQNQVAPARNANVSPSPVSTAGRIISQDEIAKFYDDAYRKNLYSAAKRAELEAEINKAIAENRVR